MPRKTSDSRRAAAKPRSIEERLDKIEALLSEILNELRTEPMDRALSYKATPLDIARLEKMLKGRK